MPPAGPLQHAFLHPFYPGFKQQNAVHGLPLELSPEEVTLALEKGNLRL